MNIYTHTHIFMFVLMIKNNLDCFTIYFLNRAFSITMNIYNI